MTMSGVQLLNLKRKEKADQLIEQYWLQGVEHGPIYYEGYGRMMETIPFGEVQAMFDNRYPILADERIFQVYEGAI
jgi:hypothetical protein